MFQLPIMNLIAQADDRVPAPRQEHVGSYWFDEQASSFAAKIDFTFYAILVVSAIFFVVIVTVMTYFAIRYRRRPGHEVEKSTSHNTPLEIAWSVLPGFLLIWFFIEGANGFFEMRVTPGDAEQITVVARQFNWEFHYPDGDITTDLHLVRNRPTEFLLDSRDVLHAFFIPAFRMKQDIVPGRYGTVWAQPTQTGVFRVYCAEYCGDNHSNMITNVTVHETEEERKAATQWLTGEHTAVENGERLFKLKCAGCHSTAQRSDTSVQKTGPNFGGIWDTQETMDDGSTRTVDENYFRESIEYPNASIVAGFSRPSQMPSFKDQIVGDQFLWLMAYVKSLSGIVDEEPAEEQGEGTAEPDASGEDDPSTGDGNETDKSGDQDN